MDAEPINVRLARRLQDLRRRAGLTQAELGDRAGIKPAELSRMENGHRTPTLETLERIARGLGVPLHVLVMDNTDAQDGERQWASDNEAHLARLLRGQTDEMLRRVIAVAEALIQLG